MKNFKRTKKIIKLKYKLLDIALFPIRCVCTPIYKIYEKYKVNTIYSYKTVLNMVQYCIDYHLEYYDCIYIVLKDYTGEDLKDYGLYGFSQLRDISWGWNGEFKRVKNKIDHIYYHQREDYIRAIKELCGEPMNSEELKIEFTKEDSNGRNYISHVYYNIQGEKVYKIINKE